jgi:hypothetical protein
MSTESSRARTTAAVTAGGVVSTLWAEALVEQGLERATRLAAAEATAVAVDTTA